MRLKSDQEPAVVEIIRCTKEDRSHDTMMLHKTKGSQQLNGLVEKQLEARLEGMVRTLRSQVFASTGIDVTATLVGESCWMVLVGTAHPAATKILRNACSVNGVLILVHDVLVEVCEACFLRYRVRHDSCCNRFLFQVPGWQGKTIRRRTY